MLMPWLITTGRRINVANIIFSFWFKIDQTIAKRLCVNPEEGGGCRCWVIMIKACCSRYRRATFRCTWPNLRSKNDSVIVWHRNVLSNVLKTWVDRVSRLSLMPPHFFLFTYETRWIFPHFLILILLQTKWISKDTLLTNKIAYQKFRLFCITVFENNE